MEDPAPNVAVEPKPVKKRSSIERVIVWGGILALLGIVAIEYTSRKNFDQTLADLEAAVHQVDDSGTSKGIPESDIAKHVKGFASRGEETVEGQRKVTYRWPSVFKFYKLGVTVSGPGNAILVESFAAKEDEPAKP